MYLLIDLYYIFTLVILQCLLHICVSLLFILWRFNKIQSINQFKNNGDKPINDTLTNRALYNMASRFKIAMKQTYIQEKSVEIGLQLQLINQ